MHRRSKGEQEEPMYPEDSTIWISSSSLTLDSTKRRFPRGGEREDRQEGFGPGVSGEEKTPATAGATLGFLGGGSGEKKDVGKSYPSPLYRQRKNTPGYSGRRAGDSGGPESLGLHTRSIWGSLKTFWRGSEVSGKGPGYSGLEKDAYWKWPRVSGKRPGYSGMADS